MIHYKIIDSPIGSLRLVSNGIELVSIEFENQHGDEGNAINDPVLKITAQQLQEYFAGERQQFDIAMAAAGTQFQKQVWLALTEIPYGETRSYAQLAAMVQRPKAARAVGAANGKNPIPIIVPCHRVIGSNGRLTGFAGGLSAKETLLEIEREAGSS